MDYVHPCYKKETYRKAYTPTIQPMSGPNMWKKSDATPPLPPKERNMPGRPKKMRRKEPEEIIDANSSNKKLRKTYVVITCSLCKGEGHNAAGCPSVPASTVNKKQKVFQ